MKCSYSARPKTPAPIHEVCWHQDAGLRADGGPSLAPISDRMKAFGPDRMMNFWIALQSTNVSNGAMQFIPRSHKLGILPHQLLKRYLGMEVPNESAHGKLQPGTYMTGVNPQAVMSAVDKFGIIDICVESGDLVVFNNLLIHRGGVNRTKNIRWSFDWRLQDATAPTYRAEQGHVIWADKRLEKKYQIVKDATDWSRRYLS